MQKKKQPRKFDWEGFWLSFGMGTGFILLSVFMFWVFFSGIPKVKTTPSYFPQNPIAILLPHSLKQWIFFGLSGVFGLFGVLLIGVGIRWIFQKTKEKDQK